MSGPLDRAAMERVLARAAELQVARAGTEDGLSEADLLAAAREAGLNPEHVRLAIAEERLRGVGAPRAAEGGFAAWAAGPGVVGAERVVAGAPGPALDAVGAWLEREEGMRLCRRTGDAAGAQAAWEPRRDLIGNLARGLRGGGSQALRRAAEVRAAALPAGEGRVLVRVEADVSGARRQRLAAGAVAAGGGAAAGGSLVVLGVVAHAVVGAVAAVAAAPLLAGGVAAWALARGQRANAGRTQLALERVLDAVETRLAAGPALPRPGATGAGLLEAIDGVRRALR